jgi:hypothetical protein
LCCNPIRPCAIGGRRFLRLPARKFGYLRSGVIAFVRQSGEEMTAPSPPPGWYPDPSGAPHQRYWDGWQFIAGGGPSPPPPGWYPDPSGAPGQRYWDGWQFVAGGVPSPPPLAQPQGQSPNANPYHRGSVITALAASAGVIVGSLGQWVHVMLFSVGGLDFGNWGIATLILGAVSGVALLNELYWLRGPATPRWAVLVAWAAAVDLSKPTRGGYRPLTLPSAATPNSRSPTQPAARSRQQPPAACCEEFLYWDQGCGLRLILRGPADGGATAPVCAVFPAGASSVSCGRCGPGSRPSRPLIATGNGGC